MTQPAHLAYFSPCTVCGEAAALPLPGSPYLSYCHTCSAREAMRDAARAQLEDLTAPVLGAWASVWTAAGLVLEDLEELCSEADLSTAAHEWAQPKRRAHLRRLRMAYPLPTVDAVDVPPARVGVDFAALPLLTAFYPADPRPGAGSVPVFGDSTGRIVQPFPGVDTLALALPDGVRAVLYTGQGGQLPYKPTLSSEAPGYRVPAELWPAFEVYLSGREAWADLPAHPVRAKVPAPEAAPVPTLPALIAARQEGPGILFLCDRAGQVFEYRTDPAAPYTLSGRRGEAKKGKPYTLTLWPTLAPLLSSPPPAPEGASA